MRISTYVAKNCPTFIFSNKQNYDKFTHTLFGCFFTFIFFCFALGIFGCLKAAVKLDSKSNGCIYLWIIFAFFQSISYYYNAKLALSCFVKNI